MHPYNLPLRHKEQFAYRHYLWRAMILRFLFFAFVAYLFFKLLVDFILPVYRTTRQVKQKFREMNQQMRGQQGAQAASNKQQKDNSGTTKSPLGEYIDFEEVKEN